MDSTSLAVTSRQDYKIVSPLGRGAYSCVYRVQSLRTGEEFALKIIDKSQLTQVRLAKRLINEIKLQSSLDHPGIVKLYHFFEDSEAVYLLLELCSGGELYTYIQSEGPLSEQETKTLITQLVDGLVYLHSQGIIHRDLKLGNLLLSNDKRHLKIADFGLSVQLNHLEAERNTLCGTPNYISPQVVMRKPYGLSTDLWSLGCIIYAVLTGAPPFESTTAQALKPRNLVMPGHLSAQVKDLVQSLLTWESAQRLDIAQVRAHPFFEDCVYYEYYEQVSPSATRLPLKETSVNRASRGSGSNVGKENNAAPLNTTGLKPMKHRTRKTEVEITSEGWVRVATSKNRLEVSADGLTVLYKSRHFSYKELPRAGSQLYEYAKRVVEAVKSKTPKVTVRGDRCLFMLMMDAPLSTFEADFEGGTRVTYKMGCELFRVCLKGGPCVDVNPYEDLEGLEPDVYRVVDASMQGLKAVLVREKHLNK